MEWFLLGIVLVFMIWSIQILMVYRKQVDKINMHIDLAETGRAEVTEQAESYEARGEELMETLNDLKSEVESLEKTEKGLEREVEQFVQDASRGRPTRHRVEPTEDGRE